MTGDAGRLQRRGSVTGNGSGLQGVKRDQPVDGRSNPPTDSKSRSDEGLKTLDRAVDPSRVVLATDVGTVVGRVSTMQAVIICALFGAASR